MKIRIKDNSIRFRLTKSEVQTLGTVFYIEGQTHFIDSIFRYAIDAHAESDMLSAEYKKDKITLFFPKQIAMEWYQNDRITYQHQMQVSDGQALKILIEKDFVCLDHTDEDQSDNYPNPNKTC
jgi:hypothetical protein